MPITFVGQVESQSTTGTAITLTLPGGTQAGDLVLVFEARAAAAAPAGMSTGGYATHATGTTSASLACYYKFMPATPDASAVIAAGTNTQGHAGIARVYRGVDPLTPFDVAATQATGSSTNPNPPSNTSVTGSATVVIAAASNVDDTTVGTVTNYGNLGDINSNSTTDVTLGTADRVIVGAAAEDPPAWSSWSTAAWRTMTVMLRPMINPWYQPLTRANPHALRPRALTAAAVAAGLFWSGVTPPEPVLGDVAAASFDTEVPYRRTLMYQALHEPVPIIAVVAPADDRHSATYSPVIHQRDLLYQALHEPVPVIETVTLDKWHRPLAEPTRRERRAQPPAHTWATVPIALDEFKGWFRPLAEPTRRKPTVHPAALTWAPQTLVPLEFKGWFRPLAEPTRAKPRIQPPALAWSTQPIALDAFKGWHRPLAEPTRRKPTVQPAAFTWGYTTPDVVVVTPDWGWYRPLDEPTRRALRAQPPALIWSYGTPVIVTISSQTTVLYPRTILYQAFAQPVPIVAAPAEEITLDKWSRPLAEPTRRKQVAQPPAFTWGYTTPAPVVVPDYGWYRPLSEPTRRKTTVHLHRFVQGPVEFAPVVTPVIEGRFYVTIIG